MTKVVRHPFAGSLFLGVVVALLTTGCGTSSTDAVSHASAPISTGSTPRIGQSQVYRVPGLSMEPTLPIGTRVVVKGRSPSVGDIVVFYPPKDSLQEECGPKPHVLKPGGAACDAPIPGESKVKLIEGVVAGPGDEIYVQGGHVYRKANGSGPFVRERDSHIRACGLSSECDFPVPIKIPAGHWFLMGDNRGESDDSRFYGPVPTAWIIGVVTGVVSRPRFESIRRHSKRQSFRGVAVAKVVACLHKANVNIPRSDTALLSSTSGIKTRSPQVKAAISKCRSESLTAASR